MANNFSSLNNEELKAVTAFFQKDVVAANPEKPTKKEYVAALGASDEDSEPVSWEDYLTLFKQAQSNEPVEPTEEHADQTPDGIVEEVAGANEPETADLVDGANQGPIITSETVPLRASGTPLIEVDEEPVENSIIVKMTRKNPTFEIRGLLFTQEHPYQPVDPDTADYLTRHVPGFKVVLASEAADYYGV